jgi:hypothetical protein
MSFAIQGTLVVNIMTDEVNIEDIENKLAQQDLIYLFIPSQERSASPSGIVEWMTL